MQDGQDNEATRWAGEAPDATPAAAEELFRETQPVAPVRPLVDEADVDVDADDEEDAKGISTGTKVIAVAAAWLLLVFFLIGQFKGDDSDPGRGPVGLDQVTGPGGGAGTAGEEASEGAYEEPVDEDGDGEIEPGEPGYADATVVGGEVSATPGQAGGGASGSTGGSDEPPTNLGSTPTTAASGSAPSTPTTTSGGATSTTAKGSSSTTAPAAATVHVDDDGGCEFDRSSVSISSNGTVTFVNDSGSKLKLWFGGGPPAQLDKNASVSRQFTQTTTVGCGDEADDFDDQLTVNVS